ELADVEIIVIHPELFDGREQRRIFVVLHSMPPIAAKALAKVIIEGGRQGSNDLRLGKAKWFVE
ncbi:MAG: hypothetical protein JO212_12300, partial [Acetobacteraceae bacterium]|nr:hypothetical protein [Acetobacteraceae bacterium]